MNMTSKSQTFDGKDSNQFDNFIQLIQDPARQIGTSKGIGVIDGKDRAFVNELFNVFQGHFNSILSELLTSKNSSKCSEDLDYVAENLMEGGWAAQMLDAYGKPESGLLIGNAKWLGEFDECRSIYAPPEVNANAGNFYGKYCTLTIPLSLQNKSLPLSLGVCLPDSCNPSGSIFSNTQINLNGSFSKFAEKINSVLNDTKIACQPSEIEYSGGAIAVIFLLCLFGLLALIGSSITVYEHLYKEHMEKKPSDEADASEKPTVNGDVEEMPSRHSVDDMKTGDTSRKILPEWLEKLKPFFACFCFFTNGEKILNTSNTEGQLPCLHGIRFLSMSWIILGHTYVFAFPFVRNPLEAVNILDAWTFQLLANGGYAVDSFFLLSGFLVAFLFFKQIDKSNGKIPWIYFYVHRYIRLTPVYLIVLAFFTTVSSHLGNGPLWTANFDDPNCKKNWWFNMLYINNLQTSVDQCMAWSWYLANDMQFYVISPLILVTLWRWPKIGASVMGLFFSITFITNFVLTYVYNLPTGLGNIIEESAHYDEFLPRHLDAFNKIYTKPYARVGPYLLGLSLAYYLYKRKKENAGKLHRITLLVGWIVSSVVACICFFALYHQNPVLVAASFYNAFNRVLFVCCVSWVIFVCISGHGGVVNSILSWNVWIPLSRLTFCNYLVHPIIMGSYYSSMRKLPEFSHTTLILYFLGFLIISYGTALLTSLLLESPVIRLERLIRNKFANKKQ